MINKNILIISIFLISFLSIGEIYRADVDTDYGFYQFRNLENPEKPIEYHSGKDYKYVVINQGDTIEFRNMDDTEEVHIVSTTGIFYQVNNELERTYQSFRYTFNESGNFEIWTLHGKLFSMTIVVKENLNTSLSDYPIKIRGDGIVEYPIDSIDNTNSTPIIDEPDIKSTNNIQTIPKETSGFGFGLIIVSIVFVIIIRRIK